jgi:hypothetical protein
MFFNKKNWIRIIVYMELGFFCASTQKATQIKVEFKKIDHFFVGNGKWGLWNMSRLLEPKEVF